MGIGPLVERFSAGGRRKYGQINAKMNFTSSPLMAANSSEETTDWNASETTTSAPGSWSLNIHWTTYVIVSVQWVTFFVGTVGNLIVLAVLLWRRSRSQVGTQLFVGSLAIADIGLMFSTVWVEAYDELQSGWKFGIIQCKLQCIWQFLTMNCSIWTLAALSIDRYYVRLCYWNHIKTTVSMCACIHIY